MDFPTIGLVLIDDFKLSRDTESDLFYRSITLAVIWSVDGMEREVGIWDASKELSAEFGDLLREEDGSFQRTVHSHFLVYVFGMMVIPKYT